MSTPESKEGKPSVCGIKGKLKEGKARLESAWRNGFALWRCDKEKLPIEEVYRVPFFFARVVGIHVVQRNAEGTYAVSYKGIIPMVVCSLVCLVALVPPILMIVFTGPPYWFMIMMVPYIFGYLFCIIAYVQMLLKSKKMIAYMETSRSMKISTKISVPVFLFWLFFYPAVLAAAALSMFSGIAALICIPPITVVSFIPATLDVYMACYMMAFYRYLNELTQEVQARDVWAGEDVQKVTDSWMYLTKLAGLHNEIFSFTLHLRVILLMTQTMSFLFCVWGMVRYDGMCIMVFLFNVVPLCEVNARFLSLCKIGESVINASHRLIRAITEAIYRIDPDLPEHFSLSALAARLEARPISIQNWGMESLSARTFVSLSSVVVTYLVVLLQFCQKSIEFTNIADGVMFTWFDSCFCENTTLMNASFTAPWNDSYLLSTYLHTDI